MTDTPKPCPFCGGEVELSDSSHTDSDGDHYPMFEIGCSCIGPVMCWHPTAEGVIARWNARHVSAEDREVADELRTIAFAMERCGPLIDSQEMPKDAKVVRRAADIIEGK